MAFKPEISQNLKTQIEIFRAYALNMTKTPSLQTMILLPSL
ncbi:hypothetical protein [Helicobacter sp. T3_23-1056]